MSSRPPRRRLLALIAATYGVGYIATYFSETVFRPLLLSVLPIFGLLIGVGFWISLGENRSARNQRWLLSALGTVAIACLGVGLFRIEGSRDGSSVPNIVWRWAPPEGSGVGDLSVSDGPEPVPVVVPEGVADSHFLGRARDGKVETDASFDWATQPPEEIWRREVGLGWSAFAVSGGYAVTQEQRGNEELVTCYRLATGVPLWKFGTTTRFSEHFGGDGPRATPVINAGKVFAQGATGTLVCLDLASGKPHWSRDVLADSEAVGNLEWGKSNTPLIAAGQVVVTGGEGGATLVAYAMGDGSVLWKSGVDTASYSSPALLDVGGESQIVSVNAASVTGHDPSTGAVRWTFDWPGPFPKVGQPVPAGPGKILVSAGYDGVGTFLLKVTPSSAEALWETNKLKTKFSSAVVYEGHAYGLHQGRLSCISLADGSRQWRGAKLGFGQNLLLPEGKLLIQAEDGRVVTARCDPVEEPKITEFEALKGKTWNPPTIAGRYLLVRNATEMACYRLEAPR